MSLIQLPARLRERLGGASDPEPPPQGKLDHRRVARWGYVLIIVTFGILGIWAAIAPLGSAVIAGGVVSVESNRKVIQHLEGGLVGKIFVHEGDRVREGQSLFQLESTQAQASYDISRSQVFRLKAQEARLNAQQASASGLTFPPDLLQQSGDPEVAAILSDEQRIFFEQRSSLEGQVAILRSRGDQARNEIEGIDREIASLKTQASFLADETAGLQELYDKDLVPKPRLLAMQRESAAVQGRIGRLMADRAKAQEGISEANLQMRQLQRQFFEQVSKDLAEVRTKLTEFEERFAVASDAVRRVNVTSPVSGLVQSLRVNTIGQVVRPGEPVAEVVPDREELIVQAQFSPTDVDAVTAGMEAEVRFPSFHDRRIPEIQGVVMSVSGDRIVDEKSGEAYFLARIRVAGDDLPPQLRGKLKPGLPAEVIVPTGERTVLQYIFEPLLNSLRLAGREQ